MLQAYGRHYYDDIMRLLGVVPSDLLLLLKANDCLRHLDRLLHTPINSTAVVGEVASRIIYEEELQAIFDPAKGIKSWWDQAWDWYAIWTDYWNVRSRTTALSVFGNVVSHIQTTVSKWKAWRNRLFSFFYVLLGL